MITSVFGFKRSISQAYTRDGRRVPVTVVQTDPMTVTQLKSPKTEGYWAVQVGIGNKSPKHITKPQQGHTKGAKVAPRFLREARIEEKPDGEPGFKIGDKVTADTVLSAGDIVSVAGTSKGKGFAGGVKRYHFRGGPRTHGQSDRERSPGSIGSTTTPGRVYKGKRMAGHLGNKRITVRNLVVLSATSDQVLIKGVIPGPLNSLITITKTGKSDKHFESLLGQSDTLDKSAIAKEQEELAKSAGGAVKESKTAEAIKKALESQKPTP
jgi:large subunit ribosomal protein L3